jgi:hypothetical protein
MPRQVTTAPLGSWLTWEGRVTVSDSVHNIERDGAQDKRCCGGDVSELVTRDRLEEAEDVVTGEAQHGSPGGRGDSDDDILVRLALLGEVIMRRG